VKFRAKYPACADRGAFPAARHRKNTEKAWGRQDTKKGTKNPILVLISTMPVLICAGVNKKCSKPL
jgi:hypothetical protein